MAHNNSTPESILTAPVLRPEYLVQHSSPNRAARRHLRTRTGKDVFVPKMYRLPTVNEPYVKALVALTSVGSEQ